MNSWDRREDEPVNAYRAFREYLKEPLPRRIVDLQKKHPGVSGATYYRWSGDYDWYNRAADYDNSFEQARDVAIREETANAQFLIIAEEVTDYQHMRQIWTELANRQLEQLNGLSDAVAIEDAVNNLNKLAMARLRIDMLARRAMRMPTNYLPSDKGSQDYDEDAEYMLDMGGSGNAD